MLLNACKEVVIVKKGKIKYVEVGSHRGMIAMQVAIPMDMLKSLYIQALY